MARVVFHRRIVTPNGVVEEIYQLTPTGWVLTGASNNLTHIRKKLEPAEIDAKLDALNIIKELERQFNGN